MTQKLYAIKDKAIGFVHVFTTSNDYSALRMFNDTVNNPNPTNISEHPEDFSLFSLGTFDDETGNITPEVKFVEEAVVLKKTQKAK